jgi:hypothetical protein
VRFNPLLDVPTRFDQSNRKHAATLQPPSASWHDLRHCFGSWLAVNNVPDKGRMELMGHKTAEMTARYTHLSVEYKRQAVAGLPQFGKDVLESESQQISRQADSANVVAFGR